MEQVYRVNFTYEPFALVRAGEIRAALRIVKVRVFKTGEVSLFGSTVVGRREEPCPPWVSDAPSRTEEEALAVARDKAAWLGLGHALLT
jgi:hypothetical protein